LDELTSEDDRSCALAGRIAVSTIGAATNIDLTGRGNVGVRSQKRRTDKLPTARVFQITEPVTIDLVSTVREMQTHQGKGRLLAIQSLVRGHYKRQVCGTGRTDRKIVFIEPYWRGPEDAPIAVRPHNVKSET
jgi:hypothetical protein